ncbi:hypothetical protein QE152_g30926 [Popillia japonica]|uniref:Uncharacterized protein n=1 Tax=Popillia japonica TaxID=7064 RepID=A0AAW1IG81_POPJA
MEDLSLRLVDIPFDNESLDQNFIDSDNENEVPRMPESILDSDSSDDNIPLSDVANSLRRDTTTTRTAQLPFGIMQTYCFIY